jgi:hypothetical protein
MLWGCVMQSSDVILSTGVGKQTLHFTSWIRQHGRSRIARGLGIRLEVTQKTEAVIRVTMRVRLTSAKQIVRVMARKP